MAKLTMAGLGIREFDQLTLESLQALHEADQILYLATQPEKVGHRLLELGFEQAEDLRGLYRDGAVDIDNYKAILKRVLQACREHRNVCVLLPGHPRVGVTLSYWLEKLKQPLGIELRVLEGISSFCAMINEFGIDPLENGASILDANRILQKKQPLNSQIDNFIYHVCSVGVSATHLSQPAQGNQIQLLQQHLENYYSPEQKVVLISAGRGNGETTTRQEATVGSLSALLSAIHFGTTLYIPATSRSESA